MNRFVYSAVSLMFAMIIFANTPVCAQKRRTIEMPAEIKQQLVSETGSVQQCIDQSGGVKNTFKTELVYLGKDEQPEVMIRGVASCVCQPKNCINRIYRKSPGGYNLLLKADYAREIEIQKTHTFEFYDLWAAEEYKDPLTTVLYEYQYNGNKYHWDHCLMRSYLYRDAKGIIRQTGHPDISWVACHPKDPQTGKDSDLSTRKNYETPVQPIQSKIENELFPICIKDKGCGYINGAGAIVIPPNKEWDSYLWGTRFVNIGVFSEGLAPVRTKGKVGFIDKTGKFVIAPAFDDAGDFSEGLAAVLIDKTSKLWGYIDKNGIFIIKPQYTAARKFSSGLAAVQINRKFGFIDKSGKVIVEPRYESAFDFSDGLAAVFVKLWKVRYVDTTGKEVITRDSYGDSFSDGLAVVQIGLRQFGYIDKTGKVVIKLQEGATIGRFSEGLAPVYLISGLAKCGYIDKTGKIAIEAMLESCGEFSEGVASIRVPGSKQQYIDRTGTPVISTPLSGKDFRNGLAVVGYFDTDGTVGYMDKTGKVIWQPVKGKPIEIREFY